MSIDEYMDAWIDGTEFQHDVPVGSSDAYKRGYAAGRAAYEAAERAERERLERCPTCEGSGKTTFVAASSFGWKRSDCPDCHGTGKRQEVKP